MRMQQKRNTIDKISDSAGSMTKVEGPVLPFSTRQIAGIDGLIRLKQLILLFPKHELLIRGRHLLPDTSSWRSFGVSQPAGARS